MNDSPRDPLTPRARLRARLALRRQQPRRSETAMDERLTQALRREADAVPVDPEALDRIAARVGIPRIEAQPLLKTEPVRRRIPRLEGADIEAARLAAAAAPRIAGGSVRPGAALLAGTSLNDRLRGARSTTAVLAQRLGGLPRRNWALSAAGAGLVAAATAAVLLGPPAPGGGEQGSVALIAPSLLPSPLPAPTPGSPAQTSAPPASTPSADTPPGASVGEPTSNPSSGFTLGSGGAFAGELPDAGLPTSTAAATPTASSSAPAPIAVDRTTALYYTRSTADGVRLYREFTMVRSADPAGLAAVRSLLSRPAADPDYGTELPSGLRAVGYRLRGHTAELSLQGGRLPGVVARQQLVYTIGAADPDVDDVRLIHDGTPLAGIALDRDPSLLGPIWILDLDESGEIPRSYPLQGWTTTGVGPIHWEVLRGTELVAEGDAALDTATSRPTWSADLTFPAAGTYVIRASLAALGDGTTETKTVRVR